MHEMLKLFPVDPSRGVSAGEDVEKEACFILGLLAIKQDHQHAIPGPRGAPDPDPGRGWELPHPGKILSNHRHVWGSGLVPRP
jgi:hypothetical protein